MKFILEIGSKDVVITPNGAKKIGEFIFNGANFYILIDEYAIINNNFFDKDDLKKAINFKSAKKVDEYDFFGNLFTVYEITK